MTLGGPHEIPKTAQNEFNSQHSHIKLSRKSQSVDFSGHKETTSQSSTDYRTKEVLIDQQPATSNSASRNWVEPSPQITHTQPRRTSSNTSLVEISSFDNNKETDRSLTESQKSGIGDVTSSEEPTGDGGEQVKAN